MRIFSPSQRTPVEWFSNDLSMISFATDFPMIFLRFSEFFPNDFTNDFPMIFPWYSNNVLMIFRSSSNDLPEHVYGLSWKFKHSGHSGRTCSSDIQDIQDIQGKRDIETTLDNSRDSESSRKNTGTSERFLKNRKVEDLQEKWDFGIFWAVPDILRNSRNIRDQ